MWHTDLLFQMKVTNLTTIIHYQYSYSRIFKIGDIIVFFIYNKLLPIDTAPSFSILCLLLYTSSLDVQKEMFSVILLSKIRCWSLTFRKHHVYHCFLEKEKIKYKVLMFGDSTQQVAFQDSCSCKGTSDHFTPKNHPKHFPLGFLPFLAKYIFPHSYSTYRKISL